MRLLLVLLMLSVVPASAAPAPSAKKPKPTAAAVEEAERRMARGAAAVESATQSKAAADFKEAAAEFEAAAAAVPDMADAYFNAGMTYAKAGEHAAAARNLKCYIELAPKAPDIKAAKALLAKEEFLLEKAAKAAKGPDLSALAGDWIQNEGLVWYSKTDVVDGALRLRTVAYEESGRRQTADDGHWGHYRFKWDGAAFKGVYIEGAQGRACAGRESPASAAYDAEKREMTVTMNKQYDHPAPGGVVNPRECVHAPKPAYTFTMTRQ